MIIDGGTVAMLRVAWASDTARTAVLDAYAAAVVALELAYDGEAEYYTGPAEAQRQTREIRIRRLGRVDGLATAIHALN